MYKVSTLVRRRDIQIPRRSLQGAREKRPPRQERHPRGCSLLRNAPQFGATHAHCSHLPNIEGRRFPQVHGVVYHTETGHSPTPWLKYQKMNKLLPVTYALQDLTQLTLQSRTNLLLFNTRLFFLVHSKCNATQMYQPWAFIASSYYCFSKRLFSI